eukprot:Skav200414  [mRNA]  locus=scaffold3090:48354:52216:- [translate_table: standard]
MNLRRKADLAAIKAESQIEETLCIGDLPPDGVPPDGAGACKRHSGELSQTTRIAPDIETFHTAQVVTGGRVRIGYRIVLSQASDYSAWRFSQEEDYKEWRHRLEVLELGESAKAVGFVAPVWPKFTPPVPAAAPRYVDR